MADDPARAVRPAPSDHLSNRNSIGQVVLNRSAPTALMISDRFSDSVTLCCGSIPGMGSNSVEPDRPNRITLRALRSGRRAPASTTPSAGTGHQAVTGIRVRVGEMRGVRLPC
jgi:hypothetical protein